MVGSYVDALCVHTAISRKTNAFDLYLVPDFPMIGNYQTKVPEFMLGQIGFGTHCSGRTLYVRSWPPFQLPALR